jgi:transient receptor potential cation channel subfamily M member 3
LTNDKTSNKSKSEPEQRQQFKPIHLDLKTRREKKKLTYKLKIGKKLYEFFNAPVTKFLQNTIFFLIFLCCFAYIVLVKTPKQPSYVEIFVLVYIFSYGLDKFRELLQTDSTRFRGKFKIFFSNIMNIFDALSIVSIIVALFFRLSCDDEDIKIARLIYCINTIFWNVKSMEYLIINRHTGPLIIIASRMVIYFYVIQLIFEYFFCI